MGDFRALAAGFAGDRRLGQLGAAGFHDERVVERVPRAVHVRGGGGLVVVAQVVADEVAGDAELHVGLDVRIVRGVDLRDERLEAVLAGEEMQMRGPR